LKHKILYKNVKLIKYYFFQKYILSNLFILKGGSNNYIIVIPANAGIPCSCGLGDSCIRRNYHAGSGTKTNKNSLTSPSAPLHLWRGAEGEVNFHRNDSFSSSTFKSFI